MNLLEVFKKLLSRKLKKARVKIHPISIRFPGRTSLWPSRVKPDLLSIQNISPTSSPNISPCVPIIDQCAAGLTHLQWENNQASINSNQNSGLGELVKLNRRYSMSEKLTEIHLNKSPLLPPVFPVPALPACCAPPPLSECNGANLPHNSTIRITHALPPAPY